MNGSETAAGGSPDIDTRLVVLGAGPGGYTAAFRAADLGIETVLVERYEALGGVCLNVGCIPSKALLHTAEVMAAARELAQRGVAFGEPAIDLTRLAAYKDALVGRLTRGLAGLARRRKIRVIHGRGRFAAPRRLVVETGEGTLGNGLEHAIIAAGSQAAEVAAFPSDDPRVLDSTAALRLEAIPERLLVVGGGIIGLEMAGVYHALGARVTVVELLDGLMPGCDRDLVAVLHKRLAAQYENIFLATEVTAVTAREDALEVSFRGAGAAAAERFDRVLVAVGRRPNGLQIGAERAGVQVAEGGVIPVDRQQRTNVPHIFAIGDIAGPPMLAHKATHEGKVAAEVIAGRNAAFDALAIPSVAFTDPEVAWMGLTEGDAERDGVAYEKAVFPWAASGRALGLGRDEGLTKLLFDPGSRRLLGAGIVGPHAGDLISEAVLALEMGAEADDLALTIHPHPTLSETLSFAAEMAAGSITDLYVPRDKAK